MTKLELLALLDKFPTDAQVIFNDDKNNKVLSLVDIHFLEGDFLPDLCPDKPCPRIIIHVK